MATLNRSALALRQRSLHRAALALRLTSLHRAAYALRLCVLHRAVLALGLISQHRTALALSLTSLHRAALALRLTNITNITPSLPHLHSDEAIQLQMPFHHGEAPQQVFTSGSKMRELPGQERQSDREIQRKKS